MYIFFMIFFFFAILEPAQTRTGTEIDVYGIKEPEPKLEP